MAASSWPRMRSLWASACTRYVFLGGALLSPKTDIYFHGIWPNLSRRSSYIANCLKHLQYYPRHDPMTTISNTARIRIRRWRRSSEVGSSRSDQGANRRISGFCRRHPSSSIKHAEALRDCNQTDAPDVATQKKKPAVFWRAASGWVFEVGGVPSPPYPKYR